MKISTIIIIVTEKCNLRCKYCYVNKTNGLTISDDVIEYLPVFLNNIIVKNDIKSLHIDLFGGEAIMEWEKFCKIVDNINEVKKMRPDVNIAIMTTSNLTLLNKEKVEYLKNNEIGISMSLDGGRSSHDRCRVYPNGKGSYDDCIKGATLYCEANNRPISSKIFKFMISPDNIDYVLDGIKDYIKDGFRRINLSIVRDCDWNDVQLERLKNFYIEYVEFLVDKFYSETPFLDTGLLLPYRCKAHGRTYFCSAGSSTIALAPNGDIYPCQRFFNNRFEHTKLGSIFTDIDETNNIANIYKNFSHDISPKCRNCELYGVCYGQCFAAIMEHGKKNICEPIDGVCKAIKLFYDASEMFINKIGYDNIRIKFNLKDDD
jgi:uncharacterized protein